MERASGDKVLIIEDERDVVDLLALNLRKAGFSVSSAADGAAGLSIAGLKRTTQLYRLLTRVQFKR
jgi:DNA-binding response OmpR family regulator